MSLKRIVGLEPRTVSRDASAGEFRAQLLPGTGRDTVLVPSIGAGITAPQPYTAKHVRHLLLLLSLALSGCCTLPSPEAPAPQQYEWRTTGPNRPRTWARHATIAAAVTAVGGLFGKAKEAALGMAAFYTLREVYQGLDGEWQWEQIGDITGPWLVFVVTWQPWGDMQ